MTWKRIKFFRIRLYGVLVEGRVIGSVMIMFALVFNGTNVAVFVALIHGIKQLQSVAECIMNAMIGPFSLLWSPHILILGALIFVDTSSLPHALWQA